MGSEINITTSNEDLNSLLSSGGMYGMLNTIWLIICNDFWRCNGGYGSLRRLSTPIINLAKTNGNLPYNSGTCIFFNLTASDQYLSIVVPGRMFSKLTRKKDCTRKLK